MSGRHASFASYALICAVSRRYSSKLHPEFAI